MMLRNKHILLIKINKHKIHHPDTSVTFVDESARTVADFIVTNKHTYDATNILQV